MSRPQHRLPLTLALAAAGLVGACGVEPSDKTKEAVEEVVSEATRKAGEGVDKAREGSRQLADEASRKAGEGVDKAREGIADAREGIADARAHYEVDERLDEAKRNLGESMDDAAKSFEELAANSKQQADDLGKRLAESDEEGLVIEAGQIECDGADASRMCRIAPAFVAELAGEPRMLARDVSLWPHDSGRGLQLVRVSPNGFASALGLREGDILLELNGAKLRSFEAIGALDEALRGKPEAKLSFERDGQTLELSVMQQAP